MKSEKGITLTSLIIYIVVIMLVIGMLSLVSQNFYRNTSYITDMGKYTAEFNKFNMYFIKDVKNNSDIYSITNNEIVFDDGNTYTYSQEAIYRNKVKICSNIKKCMFEQIEEKDDNNFTKKIINVVMAINGSKSFVTQNSYVLKYW